MIYSNAVDLHQDRVNDHRQNIMVGLHKICRVVNLISMIMTLTVAAVSFVGTVITGFYPGIIVLLFLTLIPIASEFYTKKTNSKSKSGQRNYFMTIIFINLLTIIVVLWMTFVILVDRVLGKVL